MANELQTLADRINASRQTASPGSASGTILGYMAELVDVLRVDKEAPGTSNQSETVKRLNEEINRQAAILQQIKAALEAPDEVTMYQLPVFAKSILTWAKTGTKT